MTGYTPVFDSIFTGSLFGQYPDTAAWLFFLALADKHGVVDVTPQFIAGVTGMPVQELESCISRFMEPDPSSRTKDNEGRRLELIDPGRKWGWRIVNFAAYKERARLMAKNAREVQSGSNAERLRQRNSTAGDRRRPPDTADGRPSNTNTDANTDAGSTTAASRPSPRVRKQAKASDSQFDELRAAYPSRSGSQPWSRARKAINARLQEGRVWTEIFVGVQRYAAYCNMTGKTGTEFVMQAATFFGPECHFEQPWNAPATKADTRLHGNVAAPAEAKRRLFGDQP